MTRKTSAERKISLLDFEFAYELSPSSFHIYSTSSITIHLLVFKSSPNETKENNNAVPVK